MKRIFFLIILTLFTTITFSCNDSSGSSITTGYNDPGLSEDGTTNTVKAINQYKAYTLPDIGGETCAANPRCNSIIYQGTLNNLAYVGIAVNDKHDASPDFNLKIYWTGDTTIPTSKVLTPGSYTIKIVKAGKEYTTPSADLTIYISLNANGVYDITFGNDITVAASDTNDTTTVAIKTTSSISAYKYPE